MSLRRLACFGALVVLALTGTAVPAHAKTLNGCAVLAREELETIFEQPFAKGTVLQGDYCQFNKAAAAEVPNIIVQVLVTRFKDVAKAKTQFERAAVTSEDLAGSVSNVKALGDEAFSAFLIGTDQVTVRAGKVIGRFRIDQPDSDNTFGEQALAVALAAAPRLENYSKAG
jgi:hypothetical protein